MGLVVDTNVFIDAEHGRFDLARLAHYDSAYIAAITVSELLAGAQLAASPAIKVRRAAFAEAVITQIAILDVTREVARVYADLYARVLRQRGRQSRNVHDLQIAATAIAHGHAVLTSNRNDFKQVAGLIVESPCAR